MKSRRHILRLMATASGLMFSLPVVGAEALHALLGTAFSQKTVRVIRNRRTDPRRVSIYASEFAERAAIDFVRHEEEAGRLQCYYSETDDQFQWNYVFKDESSFQNWHKYINSGLLSKKISTVYSKPFGGSGPDLQIEVL